MKHSFTLSCHVASFVARQQSFHASCAAVSNIFFSYLDIRRRSNGVFHRSVVLGKLLGDESHGLVISASGRVHAGTHGCVFECVRVYVDSGLSMCTTVYMCVSVCTCACVLACVYECVREHARVCLYFVAAYVGVCIYTSYLYVRLACLPWIHKRVRMCMYMCERTCASRFLYESVCKSVYMKAVPICMVMHTHGAFVPVCA